MKDEKLIRLEDVEEHTEVHIPLQLHNIDQCGVTYVCICLTARPIWLYTYITMRVHTDAGWNNSFYQIRTSAKD